MLKHITSLLSSEQASEILLGVDNAKSGICCMYGWMVRMLFKRARGKLSPKKDGFLGLTPVYSETTALSKPYFYLSAEV